ncbi:MAG: outer membrane protein transport protein [Bacteroidia bacterium]
MKKSILQLAASVLLCGAALNSNAQTDVDAFRYSTENISGTSRFTGMSGAFGALGGDFSVLSTNPAGIGVYRSGEVTFTPSIFAGTTNSLFQGQSGSDTKYNFNFGNAGIVFTGKMGKQDDSPGWKNWNFAFGYNRINNFNNRSIYEGQNDKNTMLDYFVQNSNGKDYSKLDSYYEYMAYYNYLINPDSANNYSSAFSPQSITQRRTSESRGSMGEVVISFGGNYSNKLFLGATLGIQNLRYEEESIYEEVKDPAVTTDTLNNYRFTQNLTTDGSGVNVKLGMIYKPSDYFRIGLAFHTPTWFNMTDLYKNKMSAQFDGGTVLSSESPDGNYEYDLTTPFKAIGSVAFLFNQQGALDIDYTFSDYSNARFHASDYGFFETNNAISHKYTAVHSLRVGTEWRLDNISFRGGIHYSSSPMTALYKVSGNDFSKKGFSLGFGMRDTHFFLDVAYLYTISNQYFQPYSLNTESVPGVKTDVSSNNFTVTLGVKF